MPRFRVTYREEREVLLEKTEVIESSARADVEALAEWRLNHGEIVFEDLGGRPVGFPWVDRMRRFRMAKKMNRGEVMQAAQHIKTENALRSISRAFPMTAISELRIRRESDGSGFEIEMMQGPPGYTTRFQLDRVPGDVGLALVDALRYAVFQQQQQTSEKLDQMGVEG